jgi:hypothetical protein
MSQAFGTVIEPLSTSPLTRLGIFGLGGLVTKGVPYIYRTLGGIIDFDAGKLTGTVDLIRTTAYREAQVALAFVKYKKARDAVKTIVREKIKSTTTIKGRNLKRITIESLYELENLVLLDTFNEIVEELYNQSVWKDAVDRSYEKFYFVGFTDDLPTRGETSEGIHFRILPAEYSIATETRPAVNKTIWQLIKRFQGYTKVAAVLDYMLLEYLFKNSTTYTTQTVLQILAHLDQCPGLEQTPDLEKFLADEIIRIGVFKQVSNSLKNEEWITPTQYDLIKPNISDKALEAVIEHSTTSWSKPQVRKNENGPFKLRILPLANNFVYSEDLKEPCLQIGRLYTGKQISTKNVTLPAIKMLNGGPDGNKPIATFIFDRDFGDWHGPLEQESAALEVAHVIPSFFGVVRPSEPNSDVERRHWQVIYKSREKWSNLCIDFQRMKTTEKYMYGVHSFSGPNTYLVNSDAFINTNKEIAIDEKTGKKYTPIQLFT